MKTIQEAKKQRLIKQANMLLDRIEANIHSLISSIKEERNEKADKKAA